MACPVFVCHASDRLLQAIQRLTADPRLSILQDAVPEVRLPPRVCIALSDCAYRLPRRVVVAQLQQPLEIRNVQSKLQISTSNAA